MYPAIRNITFDCFGDPYDLGRFWSELLGRPLNADDKPGKPDAMIAGPAGAPGLLFMRVPEGKTVKNRVHLDLQPPDGRTREEEVERVLTLGARLLDDLRTPDGRGWVVFADPEGNEFCVERSKAERLAHGDEL
jgi:predicted enzyme related to lactoylglutathione lyase